jgi:hypothetical protein
VIDVSFVVNVVMATKVFIVMEWSGQRLNQWMFVILKILVSSFRFTMRSGHWFF